MHTTYWTETRAWVGCNHMAAGGYAMLTGCVVSIKKRRTYN